ncbi:DNA (cytosine-5)-methyltransferase 1 [Chryseobacterium sp. 52]|uniref:DNA cytosine methyltransferase n=1 Tax=Chryseobacterium sp. 52 TaxID=2035213 RepID=UPI000C19D92F|nr:DNA cytosine methyltransferase [Chryseobacterium sp. 52]PIF44898.1 DNA (cytosine-5)-methyltransferase 1 [Chryseobacterium sp. 52]
MEKQLVLGSLFSGVGGFELGAEMSGITTLWNCEFEEHNRLILKKNYPDTKQYHDVRTMAFPEYVDIICGGFPCQDLSIANVSNKEIWKDGKVEGIKGERSGLWSEMWRICGEVRPKYILIENSPMLLIRGFEQVLCDLSEIGYVCEWECFYASQFGFNHKRERFFGIAYPGEVRRFNNNAVFRELHEVLPKQTPRQNPLSMPIKRFNSRSDFESVRMDDGFSKELDKRRIEMMGNAVIPDIAHYLFECIKIHYNNTKNYKIWQH